MRILYVGDLKGMSLQRFSALRRLGHQVTSIDPESFLPRHRAVTFWMWRTGSLGLAEYVRRCVARQASRQRYDLAWVDHGHLVSAGLVRDLKARIPIVLCYNTDNPFVGRDMRLWTQYIRAVPYYDLLVVVRPSNVPEAYSAGARRVMFTFMSADEVAHAPRQLTPEDYARWSSDVVFVGTAFAERGAFVAELIARGTPISIWGNQWQRMKEWPVLKPHWRGPGVDDPELYWKPLTAAKVCLGLISRGNRDFHTSRSMEIPSIGALLCAERTEEHSALYQEGEEAVFWGDAEECSRVCKELLADENRRRSIAAEGRQRFLANGWTNMRVIEQVLRIAAGTSTEALDRYHASLPVTVSR